MSQDVTTHDPRTVAYVAPFGCFMAFLIVPDVLSMLGFAAPQPDAQSPMDSIRLWLYPLQTIVTLVVLVCYWKHFTFGPYQGWLLGICAGLLGILLWILPGYLFEARQLPEGWWKHFGFAQRTDGFDPNSAASRGVAFYWFTILMRFVRLVVVVPLVEELFWRGFLMRFLADLDGDYWKIPFGTFHQRSLLVVTTLFVLVHAPVDYAAALIFGLLMYGLAVKTKSLSACVIMHATANLVLGVYVMATHNWGYW
ncbi:MAG: CAAX prenyl protease-related protein [Fuerstiella sp.]